jgi:beta-lactamase regulating signal transducer with metallopeptidase domain
MNTILSMLVPATVASGAAAAALALSSGAPARLRLGIAMAGLLAWVIPWPLLILPLASQGSNALNWVSTIAAGMAGAGIDGATQIPAIQPLENEQAATFMTWLPGTLMIIALIPGLLMFGADVLRYHRTLRLWGWDSQSREQLRIVLPEAVRRVPYAIRVVSGSRIAAVTGLIRGTIWVGDGLTGHSDLKAALLHECLHIDRKDTVTILAVTLLKRLYYWNPLVRHLAHRAGFLIEAACDERCAHLLGRNEYRNSLARLILDSQSTPRMAFTSTVRTGKHDLARVAALGRIPRVHARAWIGALLCVSGLGAAATLNAQSDTDPRIGSWDELRTSTHYDSLLRVFRSLDNGMIRMEVNFKLLEVNRWHVDFRCDGGTYRTLTYDGKFVGITYSCKRTGARTVESSFTYGPADPGVDQRGVSPGRPAGKLTEEVSADGKYYRTTGITPLASGGVQKIHREFVRRN